MSAMRDPDRLIQAYLADGIDELPDRAYDAVRDEIERKRQRVVLGPWRDDQLTRYATFAFAAAAVVLAAVIGIRFLPGFTSGPGGTPSALPPAASATPAASSTPSVSAVPAESPTSAPTPSPLPSPVVDPVGRLQAGTYVVHPFDSILGLDARAFSFTTPSDNWEALQLGPRRTTGVVWNDGSGTSHGAALGFVKVYSVNSDACQWVDTADDVAIGPTANDLIEALASSDQFEGRDAVMHDLVPGETASYRVFMPDTLTEQPRVSILDPGAETACDEGAYRIWNAEGFDIYAQGPSNEWQLSMFDLEGDRYIVLASSMPDTPPEVTDEIWQILRSVKVDPDPGCPQFSTGCN